MGLKVSGVAPDLTKNIEFEELLTSTFPGFFSAITLFMLIDILSPKELTSWVFKDISSLFGFIGFALLFGTILGVIIDGIHHEVIERFIFNKFLKMKKIDEISKALYPLKEASMYSYFHNMMGEKYIDTLSFFIKSQYRYSEFHANTFISLLPLSVIAPFYLIDALQVSCTLSISLGITTLIISICCLRNSYMSLLNYKNIFFSYICGHLNNYIDFRITNVSTDESSNCCKVSKDIGTNIEAQIIDIKCQKQQKGEIVFKTNFGNLSGLDNELFIWDDIPGNDDRRLIGFLGEKFGIDWAIAEKIVKNDIDKTIKLTDRNNFIILKCNNEQNTVKLEINDGRTDKFIAKIENDKLNIYEKSKEIKIEINGENKAKACLSSTKSGIAIVTASSFNCVPGEVCIEFQ